jgi:hypothetical protein
MTCEVCIVAQLELTCDENAMSTKAPLIHRIPTVAHNRPARLGYEACNGILQARILGNDWIAEDFPCKAVRADLARLASAKPGALHRHATPY